jgi:hypothetical protein
MEHTQRIEKALRDYDEGRRTWNELKSGLIEHLTPKDVPDLLRLAPPDVVEELKADALCGKPFVSVGWGCIAEQNEEAAKVHNDGLAVLREFLTQANK